MKQQMTAIIFKGKSYSFICQMHTSYNVFFQMVKLSDLSYFAFKQDISNVPSFFLCSLHFDFVFVALLFFVCFTHNIKALLFFHLAVPSSGMNICCTHHKNKVERVMESFYQMLVTYVFNI